MKNSGLKICFVGIGAMQLSISALSSIAKENGHKTFLAYNASLFNDRFNFNNSLLGKFIDETDDVLKKIDSINPNVLAFSPLTATYQWSLEVAKKAKKNNPKIKIIFGGVHVSAVPNLVINEQAIDFAVFGEGEEAFVEILKRIENKKKEFKNRIPNTFYKSETGKVIKGPGVNFCQNLDSFPFYDHEIWKEYLNPYKFYSIAVSRGCPNKCTYCFNNFYSEIPENPTNYLRFRSVDNVINELLQVKNKHDIKYIDFIDDSFTVKKEWLKKFLQKYKRLIDLPFRCLVDSKYMDKEIAYQLKESGCKWVQMGVQTLDSEYKKNKLNRHETKKQIVSAIKLMKENEIKLQLDHMLALPDEPITAQKKALEFYKKMTPDRIQTFWTTYLPGTALVKKEYRKGKLSDKELEEINLGKKYYLHRRSDNKNKNKIYRKYQLAFRMIPVLPDFIRKKIRPDIVEKTPVTVFNPFLFIIDLFNGLFSKNPDFLSYSDYYLSQIKRIIKKKLFGRPLIKK